MEKADVSRHVLHECSTDAEESTLDESDLKYGPRQVESNWEKYRPESPETTGNDWTGDTKPSDFTELLTYSSDCNYFQFKSEKNWDAEAVGNSFGSSKLFTLDVELLASGLACIPFYERVDIDKNMLPQADVDMCDKKAEESFDNYKIISDRFLKRIDSRDALAENSSKPETEIARENVEKTSLKTEEATPQSSIPKCDSPEGREIDDESSAKDVKSKSFNEENLEDWLDSVLDD